MPGPSPLWVRLAMPSLADLLFIVTFWCLTIGMWGMGMLGDAGTGWHVRNGDHILATRSIPHVDYFSYTMSGRPWYAWEWLYDVVLACAHRLAGLNGVVVLSAVIVAFTFAFLFKLAARSSGNVAIA
ncbi:MAG TPA: hypothetical protein VFM10_13725, partial [Terriglobales bacterium]|nr:hypothetical protein [Terriglobales bacterium]